MPTEKTKEKMPRRLVALDDEMAAMVAIDETLRGLSDPTTRRRVISWMVQKFGSGPEQVNGEPLTKAVPGS